jgi:hypothetical protein
MIFILCLLASTAPQGHIFEINELARLLSRQLVSADRESAVSLALTCRMLEGLVFDEPIPTRSSFISPPFHFPNLTTSRIDQACHREFNCTFRLTNQDVIYLSVCSSPAEGAQFRESVRITTLASLPSPSTPNVYAT